MALHLRRELGAGNGADHARHRERRLEPNLPDPGVRMVRADEAKVQTIGHANVGHEFAATREQTRILAPLQRAADPARFADGGHGAVSVSAGGGTGFTP